MNFDYFTNYKYTNEFTNVNSPGCLKGTLLTSTFSSTVPSFVITFSDFNGGANISADIDNSTFILVADFDNNGNYDIVVANTSGTDKVYLGNGDGTFQAAIIVDPADTFNNYSMAIGDINHDGKLDLIMGGYSQIDRYYLGK